MYCKTVQSHVAQPHPRSNWEAPTTKPEWLSKRQVNAGANTGFAATYRGPYPPSKIKSYARVCWLHKSVWLHKLQPHVSHSCCLWNLVRYQQCHSLCLHELEEFCLYPRRRHWSICSQHWCLTGWHASSILSIIVFDYVICQAMCNPELGVTLRPRRGCRHLAEYLTDLDFADDITLVSETVANA